MDLSYCKQAPINPNKILYTQSYYASLKNKRPYHEMCYRDPTKYIMSAVT